MDIYSNTVEIINLVRKVYEKYSEYQEADRTINDVRQCLRLVELDLELFEQYSKGIQPTLTDRRREVIRMSLDKVGDLLHELVEKLPPRASVSTKLQWVGWGKRRADGLLVELRIWDNDMKGTFFMLDVVKNLRGPEADELRKRLFDTGDTEFTGAWALSKRIYSLDSFEQSPDLPPLQLSSLVFSTPQDRMLGSYQGRTVYMEAHYIEEGDYRQKRRQVQSYHRLAYVFHSPDLPSLHLLPCVGLLEQSDFDRCYIIYDLPDPIPPSLSANSYVPTLARALEQQVRLTLEDRFRIAVEVCVAVFSIHAAGWVHKNIRSDNVLINVRQAETDVKSTATVGTAYLVGFQTTRPRMEGSDQRPEMDPVKRKYQHPERQGGRDTQVVRFDIRHDMYSLGAVLVEIGYRKTLREMFAIKSAFSEPGPGEAKTNHENLVRYAHRLSDKMGSKYADAALVCLTKTTERGKSSESLREEFYEGVLRPLREILNGLKVVPPTSE